MLIFISRYLLIGLIVLWIFEWLLNNSNKELNPEGLRFKNSERIWTILLWPLAILYVIFG